MQSCLIIQKIFLFISVMTKLLFDHFDHMIWCFEKHDLIIWVHLLAGFLSCKKVSNYILSVTISNWSAFACIIHYSFDSNEWSSSSDGRSFRCMWKSLRLRFLKISLRNNTAKQECSAKVWQLHS
jgi:hypothetical protein